MNLDDSEVGARLATLRGDVSQAALAAQMKEKGFKWSQSTVWAVEKGDRPLRFTEAVAAAEVLNSSIDLLLLDTGALDDFGAVKEGLKRAAEARAVVVDDIVRWVVQIVSLNAAAEKLKETEGDQLSEELAKYRDNLLWDVGRANDIKWEQLLAEASGEIEQSIHGGRPGEWMFSHRTDEGEEGDDGVDR